MAVCGLQLRPCFASLHALVPAVTTLRVNSTSTTSEPRTTTTATTSFAGFHDDATFGAFGDDACRRRDCYYLYSIIDQIKQKHFAVTVQACICIPSALNLHLQAFTPSDHLRSTFLLPSPPQFLNQAPPGAQQLTIPDLLNVPHFEHVIVGAIIEMIDGMLTDVLIGVLTISSRLDIG